VLAWSAKTSGSSTVGSAARARIFDLAIDENIKLMYNQEAINVVNTLRKYRASRCQGSL
jgi:hypothetical protein